MLNKMPLRKNKRYGSLPSHTSGWTYTALRLACRQEGMLMDFDHPDEGCRVWRQTLRMKSN